MNHLKIIRTFLVQKRNFEDLPEYGFPFVTLSQQAGAGGHFLSYAVLTEFLKYRDNSLFEGWHVFDRELCEVIAQDPELQSSMETLVSEKYRSEFDDFMDSLFTGQSSQYHLNKEAFRVVRMLALIGKVIIVGRSASLITADLPQGVHVRLVAPHAQRLARMMKRFKLCREKARETIDRQDSDRRKRVKRLFNRDIDDPLIYDAVWNTGKVGVDTICHSIIDLINSRADKKRKLIQHV